METTHKYFDSRVAKDIGTDCAIILYNIQHWVNYHKANKTHFYDGLHWMYNSRRAFSEQFDWLSDGQIKTCLSKLEKKGYVICGNHNKAGFDRTKWYSIPLNSTIGQNRPMDESKTTNALANNDQPIPNNNPNNKTIDFNKLIAYFNKVFNKGAKVVNPEVRSAFNKRLKDGYTKEDIVKVIDNCFGDNHHKETDYKYVTLEFLSRPKIFERYASLAHKKPEHTKPQNEDAFYNQ